MIDIDILHFFLGLQVLPLSYGLFISHSKYVMDLLKCFTMGNLKDCVTPYMLCVRLTKDYESFQFNATLYRRLVGRLSYLTHSNIGVLLHVGS